MVHVHYAMEVKKMAKVLNRFFERWRRSTLACRLYFLFGLLVSKIAMTMLVCAALRLRSLSGDAVWSNFFGIGIILTLIGCYGSFYVMWRPSKHSQLPTAAPCKINCNRDVMAVAAIAAMLCLGSLLSASPSSLETVHGCAVLASIALAIFNVTVFNLITWA